MYGVGLTLTHTENVKLGSHGLQSDKLGLAWERPLATLVRSIKMAHLSHLLWVVGFPGKVWNKKAPRNA